jgi:hypothetical protein
MVELNSLQLSSSGLGAAIPADWPTKAKAISSVTGDFRFIENFMGTE